MNLKELLGEHYSEEIASKLKNFDVFEKGKAMPIEKFNAKIDEVNTQKKELKEQVDTLNKNLQENNKALEKFKSGAELSEEYKKQLEEIQNKSTSLQKEFQTQLTQKETEWQQRDINNRKQYALREKLLMENADPAYIDMLQSQIDLTAITEQEGKFIGLDDVIGGVKTKYEKLFGKPVIAGTGLNNGNQVPNQNITELENKVRMGDKKARLELMKAQSSAK